MLSFKELQIPAPLLTAIEEVGYETPSPIQAQTIPALLNGRNVLGQAQTGTGKTAAFALPILSKIDLNQTYPQALVLTPTRELAIQVAESFQQYAKHLDDFHVLPIYGGADIRPQLRALKRGVHVVVGTPGRVMDHLERKTLMLDNLSMIVLDEADEMLKMGFIEDVEWILEHAPANCQTALFSATMPTSIQNIVHHYLDNPIKVHVKQEKQQVSNIKKRYTVVSKAHKLQALLDFLEVEETEAVIIFTRTKTGSMEVADKLEARGLRAAAINGDMKQEARERVIKRIKDGGLDIVVATEVAARGLDVERIGCVINYDIPYDVESYIHRIGRTGRAGREGTSLLFVEPKERRLLKTFERVLRENLEEVFPPSKKTLHKKRTEKLTDQIQTVLSAESLDNEREMIESIMHFSETSELDVAAALLHLFQKQHHVEEESVQVIDGDIKIPYKFHVGKIHQVMPKDIVGALTNEIGFNFEDIGRISLQKSFSIVDLPKNIPTAMMSKIKRLSIKNHTVDMEVFEKGSFQEMDNSRHKQRQRKNFSKGYDKPKRFRGD